MAEEYSWDTSVPKLWEKAAKNPPDVPHYQKLVTLAQLKTADALARYTKWLTAATVLLVICTVLELVNALWRK